MELIVRVAGAAGQGIQSLGEILARAVFRCGYFVHGEFSYHSRIRGGENAVTLRIKDRPVFSTVSKADVLVALTREMLEQYRPLLWEHGYIVVDQSLAEPGERIVALPAEEWAKKEIKFPLAIGTILLGAAAKLLGIGLEALKKAVTEVFGEKAQPNLEAVEMGYEAVDLGPLISSLPCFSQGNYMLMTGGQAVGAGAIAAGCRFLSSYPMTPGTPVMEFLAKHAGRYGIVVEQAEDEIAAINMALGAAYAGARAMVTTSGGGFALMVEGLSLAGMIETPVVIHIGQRPGPATGLPTRTSQENLLFALHAGHGEFPRYLVAPATAEDAFYLTIKAFEMAEKYQIPAIILTDQFLVDSLVVVSTLDPARVPIQNHWLSPEELERMEKYERFAVTETGVSPRALPGLSRHLVLVDSDEHDFYGRITENLEIRKLMVEKRLRKEKALAGEIEPPWIYPERLKGRIVLLGWGSTFGAIREAVEVLNEKEDVYAHVHLRELWPLPKEHLEGIWTEAKEVISVEGNATGQLGKLISAETGLRPRRLILKYDGRPFTAEEIIEEVRG